VSGHGTNPELISPCGLYCGVCRIFAATQDKDRAYLARLVRVYARYAPEMSLASAEDLLCDGCLSTRRAAHCRVCAIRECTQQRQVEGCHDCADFPCSHVDQFPIPAGRRVILRAIPYRREHGTEQWIEAERERYTCPECGQSMFRGARSCEGCGGAVDVD
jgi:hypothetical protein